jgi:hypothetical protein
MCDTSSMLSLAWIWCSVCFMTCTPGTSTSACMTIVDCVTPLLSRTAPPPAGTQHVVLTLGSLGAALISLTQPGALAAAQQDRSLSSSRLPHIDLPREHPSGSGAEAEAGSAPGRPLAGPGAGATPLPALEVVHLSALPAEVVSVNGAGTFVARRVAAAVCVACAPTTAVHSLPFGAVCAYVQALASRFVPLMAEHQLQGFTPLRGRGECVCHLVAVCTRVVVMSGTRWFGRARLSLCACLPACLPVMCRGHPGGCNGGGVVAAAGPSGCPRTRHGAQGEAGACNVGKGTHAWWAGGLAVRMPPC